jgi:hypothetical protein
MRTAPTTCDFSNIALYNNVVYPITAVALSSAGTQYAQINATVASGLVSTLPYSIITNNTTAGYIGFGAEL